MNEVPIYTPQEEPVMMASMPVDKMKIRDLTGILKEYKAAKESTDNRVVAAENWWRMRNEFEALKQTDAVKDGGYVAKTGWLHNIITNKHADYMDAMPEAIILPREKNDAREAKILSSIIPYVLKNAKFQRAYSRVGWQKFKHGTGIYKTIWDKDKDGIGGIAIERVSVLNLFWEPGIEDIQDSTYVFQVTPKSKQYLEMQYPQLRGRLKGNGGLSVKQFMNPEADKDKSKKALYIECYYKKQGILHYCTFVSGYDEPLFATENNPQDYPKGWYWHGLYPYDFDVLYPLEDNLAGYGYVDINSNPQIGIDLLKTNIMENSAAGSSPRYFVRNNSGINEEEYLNPNKKFVKLPDLTDNAIRPIDHKPLDSIYVSVMQESIQEMRETSGNTETSAGTTSRVDTASGIAALQEAAGKGSRDSNRTTYDVFENVIYKTIELIRQFMDLPQQFRIIGESGEEEFVEYSNANIVPQAQGELGGVDLGYSQPMFDIEVKVQKANAYTTAAYNELALQLYGLGFFNPQMTDQALACLSIMDLPMKDKLISILKRNGTLVEKMQLIIQYAMQMAQQYGDAQAMAQLNEMLAMVGGQQMQMPTVGGEATQMPDTTRGRSSGETLSNRARERSRNSTQPGEGGASM